MKIRNVHERRFKAPLADVGRLINTLGSSDDRLWPIRDWPAMKFDKPLSVGSVGGHGPIHYRCTEYEPSRYVTFEFLPKGLSRGLRGHHGYQVFSEGDISGMRHTLEACAGMRAACYWVAVLRPLHKALIEDSLDRAEREVLGQISRPKKWRLGVRLLRNLVRVQAQLLAKRARAPMARLPLDERGIRPD